MKLSGFTFWIILSFINGYLGAQEVSFANSPEEYDSIYNANIRMNRINGVYIPKDLAEAHEQIRALTPENTLQDFSSQEEITVCKKLHFGIGRWMILNWNFYEGSRLSHYLKQMGLSHPDDMVQFILRTLHRKLNSKDLDEENMIKTIREARLREVQEVYINKE